MLIVKNPLRRLPVLFFLAGILAGAMIYLKIEDYREDRLVEALKQRVDIEAGKNASPVAVAVAAMNVTHDVVRDGSHAAGKESEFLSRWQPCGLACELTGRGASGSYSMVLARLLEAYGYPVRIGQMKVRGKFGGHMNVETRIGESWVVLDPAFDLVFRRPDSSLASFADLQAHWANFAVQVPPGYDPNYRYEAVRYTNWDKIPLVTPAVRKLSSVFLGEGRTAGICVRVHALRVYNLCFYIVLFVSILLSVYLYCGVRGSLPWQLDAPPEMEGPGGDGAMSVGRRGMFAPDGSDMRPAG